jgi:hypothetical protein
MYRVGLRRGVGLVIMTLVVAMSAGSSAHAEVGGGAEPPAGGTGSGFQASVSITFSGDAAPSGGSSTIRVRVAPSCWWRAADGPYDDPVAMLAYYDAIMATTAPPYVKGAYGPRSRYVEAAASATPVQWWSAYCKDPSDYVGYTGEPFSYNGQPLAVTHRAFPVVNGTVTPPAPQVEPEQLAEAAREVMVLPLPAVTRNPETTGAGLVGATFVNLPTWFWVDDPAAVGGSTGTRTIRAEVAGGAVWAQVVATTQGLQVASPAGTTTCPPGRATTRWRPGAADTDGCTLTFERASTAYRAGYPVTTTTTWNATWTGSGGTGGTLPVLDRQALTQVPVAESQAVVTGG